MNFKSGDRVEVKATYNSYSHDISRIFRGKTGTVVEESYIGVLKVKFRSKDFTGKNLKTLPLDLNHEQHFFWHFGKYALEKLDTNKRKEPEKIRKDGRYGIEILDGI